MATIVIPPGGGAPGSGDVVGPASSTDNDVVLFDGATGKLIKDSGVSIDDVTNERIWEDPGLGVLPANLYVNNTTGSDVTGDGTAGNPWQTLAFTLMKIPILASERRIVNLTSSATAYTFPGRTLWAFNLCTVKGTLTTSLSDTATAGTGGTKAAGINVEVAGAGWVVDEHVGKLILWTGGALSGKYGVVYSNDADTLMVTTEEKTFVFPSSGDTFDLKERGSTIEWVPGFPYNEQLAAVSRNFFIHDVNLNVTAAGDRSLYVSTLNRVQFRRCHFGANIASVVMLRGTAQFHSCYFTNRGDDFADRGLIEVGQISSANICNGTVIDCRHATDNVNTNGSGLHALPNSNPTWLGEVVIRKMGALGYCLEGAICGIHENPGTDNVIRLIDCATGFRINKGTSEVGGSYYLPELYTNVALASNYVVTAQGGAYVSLAGGTAASVVGALAVSADNGATNTAQTSDGTYITGGSPAPPGFGSAIDTSLYGNDGTVGTTRTATLTDTLVWSGGRQTYSGSSTTSTLNGTSIVEVQQASDLPAVLAANTTYVVRGTITFSTPITVTNSGCSIVGTDRNKDLLIWDGAAGTTGITITDVSFELRNLCLSSNNTGSVVISASNLGLVTDFNWGRSEVFSMVDCQFRNCFDVAEIVGFDLVDILNTLFWYIEAPNHGLKLRSTSKTEITSCEFIRWFDETTIPTPAGYATCPMIEFEANGAGPGFGAVNINGSLFHPQQTQDGIKINSGSTAGFGTIAANTFVDVNLSTGLKFFPDPSTGGYSNAECLNYTVDTNQGLPSSDAYMLVTFVGNATDTALTSGVPAVMNAGGNAVATRSQRMTTTTDGVVTYNGTKVIEVSLTATVNFDKQGGGTDNYAFYFYKDTGGGFAQMANSVSAIRTGGNNFVLPMCYDTTLSNGDQLAIYIENLGSNDDMRVTDLQWVIKE